MKFWATIFAVVMSLLFIKAGWSAEEPETEDLSADTMMPKDLPTHLPTKHESQNRLRKQRERAQTRRFVGVIQYLQGNIKWRNARTTKSIAFKTALQEGDHLILDADGTLKVITKGQCIGVAYGPATLFTPTYSNNRWKIRGGSLRWICPGSHGQDLLLEKGNLELGPQSEVFFHLGRLLPRKGPVRSGDKSLPVGQLYAEKEGLWEGPIEGYSRAEVWDFNQKLPAPEEAWREDRPEDDRNHRLSVFAGSGGASFEPENGAYANRGMNTHLFRLQLNRLLGSRSWLYTLTMSEFVHRSQDQREPVPTFPEPLGLHSNLELAYLEMGWREDHKAPSSLFYKFGLGGVTWNAHYNFYSPSNANMASLHGHFRYPIASLAMGWDYFLGGKTLDWGGLHLGVELRATRTVGRWDAQEFFTYNPDQVSQPADYGNRFAPITTWSILLYLAPAYVF